MEGLRPCPFCGRDALSVKSRYVRCGHCGAQGPVSLDTEHDAETVWNTRDTEEKEGAMSETVKADDGTCRWHEDKYGIWWAKCGYGWEFDYDGPEENGFLYCPNCGRKLEAVWEEEEEE